MLLALVSVSKCALNHCISIDLSIDMLKKYDIPLSGGSHEAARASAPTGCRLVSRNILKHFSNKTK